ncbi:unnamed protein product [Cylindrotheca closterium]|uniref:Uncharacterized protein n=1 Tax=Cylindrotheca closterium TaxID=2856 RepID=A0AAD2JPX0_9STRA|nr:unnamed protein product [Cylindrotheca closterium]
MEALNQRHEAERAARKAKERAQREKQKTQRKQNITDVSCCIIVLIAAGVGAFFALNKDTTTITQIFITQLYDPPSEAECRAITRNEIIAGQVDLDNTVLDMSFDITISSGCEITTPQV